MVLTDADFHARYFAPLPPGGHFQDRFPKGSIGSVLYHAALGVYAIRSGVRLELFGTEDDSQGSGTGEVRLLTPHPLNRSLQGSRVRKYPM